MTDSSIPSLEGPPGELPLLPHGLHIHPLAHRYGLRVLLRILRHSSQRGSAPWRPLVPPKPQRPGLQPHPGKIGEYDIITHRIHTCLG